MAIHAHFSLSRPNFTLDAEFHAPAVGVTALFGVSGSGKTTLLRCIAGLERAAGSLSINGEIWQNEQVFLPTHRRPLGYVFQEASLFPHLSVRANLEYGYRRIPLAERKIQFDQVVAWLGLEKLIARRHPNELSGGERQRVAIGRALLTSPRLLLMDEPLSALDTRSKQDILPYLQQLQLDIPMLYVSHALDEVARLADHLVLLEQGKVIASGGLSDTLARLDLPLAHFDDAGVVIAAVVAEHDDRYQLTRLDFDGGSLWVGKVNHPLGKQVRARILARDVSLATVQPQGSSISNILPAQIVEIRDEGADKVNVLLTLGTTQKLLARLTRRSRDLLALNVGMTVFAQVKSVVLAV